MQAPQAKTILTQAPSVSVSSPKRPDVFMDQLQEFWRNFWTGRTRKNLLRIIAVIVALVVLVKIVSCVAGFIKSRPRAPKVTAVKQARKQHISKKEQAKTEGPVVAQEESNTVSAQSQNNKVTLTVHAPKNIWMQVKTDGKIVFQMTMKKGTVENWEAKNRIELSGKYISDLDLEINGRDVNLLGSSGRHAKRVLITKDGLTVKR